MISFAVSSFLIVASAGAGIENTHKAFFAAEAGAEEALFAAAEHGPGWEEPAGAVPDVPFGHINNSSGTWSVSARSTMRNIEGNTIFIPAKKDTGKSLLDWEKMPFRTGKSFKLYADSTRGAKKTVELHRNLSNQTLTDMKTKLETRINDLSGQLAFLSGNLSDPETSRKYFEIKTEVADLNFQLDKVKALLNGTTAAILPTNPDGTLNIQEKSIANALNRDDLEKVSLDIFLPVSALNSAPSGEEYLLSWNLEGIADLGSGVRRPMQLFSKKECGDTSGLDAGVPCVKHFNVAPALLPTNVKSLYREINASATADYGFGTIIRVENPVGKFRDDDGKFTEANLRDFLIGDVRDADGNPLSFTLEKPRLSLQIGTTKKGDLSLGNAEFSGVYVLASNSVILPIRLRSFKTSPFPTKPSRSKRSEVLIGTSRASR